MNKEQLDHLWHKAMRESVEDGEMFTRYHFAKMVRDDYSNKHAQLWLKRIDEAVKAEREACAMVCEELPAPDIYNDSDKSMWDVTTMDCAEAIRARST
jgi:hypothetical protein